MGSPTHTSRLIFRSESAGQPDGEMVLFLHGFPQFADSWEPILHAVANAGYFGVALEQRGYSATARPPRVADYAIEHLVADALAVADQHECPRFHVVGHDWGALVGWQLAARQPERLLSLTALAVPHPDAFFRAVKSDTDQRRRSAYIPFFRLPFHVAERVLLAADAKLLRKLYDGKLTPEALEANVQRLSEPGALTAALNWYRAIDLKQSRTGPIQVPTLYVWGDQDKALGETAALDTRNYVTGPYHFERLFGVSHWLIEEAGPAIVPMLLRHLQANRDQS